MDKNLAVVVVAFVVLALIIGPLVTIWALNTLFPILAIEYNFFTWLSVIILGSFFRAKVNVNKS